jgi:D-aminopeptidase
MHIGIRASIVTLGGLALCAGQAPSAGAQAGQRARELGLTLNGTPGPLNAITDVAGVEVGQTTLIEGDGPLVVGHGPVRTGVTVVIPRGKASTDPVMASWFTLNGNGEMTGTTWVEEGGFLEGPIAITNTHSVGVVRDAEIAWMVKRPGAQPWALPVVAETFDGGLNDVNGFHVKPEHVFAALDGARSGPVAEGGVGGGTGMVCFGFKGGIGTASRVLDARQGGYTVGVLVQCNAGNRNELRIGGVPVGRTIQDLRPCHAGAAPIGQAWLRTVPACAGPRTSDATGVVDPSMSNPLESGLGSIIIVVATDAPVLPHQLHRLVKRAALGLAAMGGRGENGSGDIFVAFSTANPGVDADTSVAAVRMLPNGKITPLFYAVADATEEAILNALWAGRTMTGADSLRVYGLPHDRVKDALRNYRALP